MGRATSSNERVNGAADMVALIAPPVTIPVHYDDYTVFRSALSDFLDEVGRRQLPGEIRTVTNRSTD